MPHTASTLALGLVCRGACPGLCGEAVHSRGRFVGRHWGALLGSDPERAPFWISPRTQHVVKLPISIEVKWVLPLQGAGTCITFCQLE